MEIYYICDVVHHTSKSILSVVLAAIQEALSILKLARDNYTIAVWHTSKTTCSSAGDCGGFRRGRGSPIATMYGYGSQWE